MTTSLSPNRLGNIYSRFRDNISQSNVVFENDSYEWETKLRFQATQFINDWKLSTGLNVQNSSYQNNTLF